MKLAFWTVTKGAGNIAREYKEKLQEHLKEDSIDVFTLKKYDVENTIQIEDFTANINENFSQYDGHIFIMASGIVIRKIASLIGTKDKDPAVLLIDEGKHFVISLLSGHLGGANELTHSLANILKLVPVITTSSDVTGKIAVDTISQKLNAELEDLKSAKDVTSLIVNGQKVNILLPKNVKVTDNISADGRCISLLKILMTNYCIYDCKYCINRKDNDIELTPDEIVKLTVNYSQLTH